MIIPQANLRNMLASISSGNHVLNEQAIFYKEVKIDCPDCGYDPIRRESTNHNCDTCDGEGSVVNTSSQAIPVSIETEEDFSHIFTQAGRITKGQILLTVDILEINTVLNLGSVYDLDDYSQIKSFVDQYSYVTWRGAKYKIASFEDGRLQGILYEISMTLNLSE